ncbi:MAG: alkaline phosphatase family protein [Candidatus Cybelea sp.]
MGAFRAAGLLPALTVSAFALSGCGGVKTYAPPATNPWQARALVGGFEAGPARKIDHIVIIVQENRSFDNLFQGYPHADTRSYGYDSKGDKIALEPIGFKTTWDLGHSSTAFFTTCNGRGKYPGTECRMNGFDQEPVFCGGSGEPRCPDAHPQYAYVPQKETKPYFAMASQYVLADHMFESDFDESSFVSHQYIIAGQASSTVNVPQGGPWGCSGKAVISTITKQRTMGPLISACLNNQTLGDELDTAGVSWRYYTANISADGGLWNAYQAIKHIYNKHDWKTDVVTPQTKFFSDVHKNRLPAVSWITPTCENSDHAGCNSNTGPMWVASLVNAIGESPYWKSSAIFIFWDDPGGWYDHVPPHKVDYDGLGYRVPLLIISPYAKDGFVSNVHYEHGSLLRFVEDRFGLPRLAASDKRATSPEADCFDFNQPPRKFVPIQSKMDERDFERQPLDLRPVDTE